MKILMTVIVSICFITLAATAATNYVSLSGTHIAPYNSWATAATNIQDAVDIASDGDIVLVNDGIYSSGGVAVSSGGDTPNRVAVPDGVTVQSMNGPDVTIIQGSGIMGSSAVRCAYVGFDALLTGFTLTNGTTQTSGSFKSDQAAGGVWCESSGVVSNCVIIKNSAESNGGGAYGGLLKECTLTENTSEINGGGASNAELINCTLVGNSAVYNGGGAYACTLTHCELIKNSAVYNGGGAFDSWLDACLLKENSAKGSGGGAMVSYDGGLENCALIGNSAGDSGGGYCFSSGPRFAFEGNFQVQGERLVFGELNNCTLTGNSASYGGGVSGGGFWASAILNNCIVYFNQAQESPNYTSCELNFSCTTPLPDDGNGNIEADPQLASASHLSTNSPCIGAGSVDYANGTDIDGEAWATLPSMGCDELLSDFALGALSMQAEANYTTVTPGYAVQFTSDIEGQTTASQWIWGDGSVTSNQPFATHAFESSGTYTVELLVYNDSNPLGVSATLTIQVDDPVIHYVDLANLNPVEPYTSWETAANTIQEAIDASTQFGAHVLVADGVYDTGGLNNRVSIKAGLTVRSVNGPKMTFIEGAGPIGPNAVRCVAMASESFLSGFTLTHGHTQATGDVYTEQSGGGVYCEASAIVSNCVIIGNAAALEGGGASGGLLIRCSILDNSAENGGGVANASVLNSVFERNYASDSGGGAAYSFLNNCTLTGNRAETSGGGTKYGTQDNCIVYHNLAPAAPNYEGGNFSSSCTTPDAFGIGNISDDPQLVSGSHLSANSPCIGAGSATLASGTDIDGDTWANPPSMGCDEPVPGAATGALSVLAEASLSLSIPNYVVSFSGSISGIPSSCEWHWDDGSVTTNQPYTTHAFTSAGTYDVELIIYNDSNPAGVSDTVTVQVNDPVVHYVDAANATPIAPYTSWITAANNIQDAIDAATSLGASVLVTNGVYASGGKLTVGITTNRVAVSEGLTVRSVTGPANTIIQGAGSLGPNAVRCVYLANNAFLTGFTLTNGATQTTGNSIDSQSGGGVWCESSGVASNCVIVGNQAKVYGGGSYDGTLILCTLSDNEANYGGGSNGGTLNHCTLSENHARYSGGASRSSTLNNCLITRNSAEDNGGGSYYGTLRNCTVVSNATGAASYDVGGGCYYGALINSIVYENTAVNSNYQNYFGTSFRYSCTLPMPSSGTGNIDTDPLFVDAHAGNYRLESGSPCIDTGDNSEVNTATDLDGALRIRYNFVDMGAYEKEYAGYFIDTDGDGIPDWWELKYFGDTTSCDPSENSDLDVHNNGQEYIADTNPTNSASFFTITHSESITPGFVIQWAPSVTNREYSVSWNTELTGSFTSLVSGIKFPQTSYTDTVHNAESSGFYKVEVQLKE